MKPLQLLALLIAIPLAPLASAEHYDPSCFAGVGSEGTGVGVGSDVARWPYNFPQPACEHRYEDCRGAYADVNRTGADGFRCTTV